MREAIRIALKAMESAPGKDFIEGEACPPSMAPLSSKSSDDEIDARMRATGSQLSHFDGTATMGTVVDSICRVKGV